MCLLWSAAARRRCLPPVLARACSSHPDAASVPASLPFPGNANLPIGVLGFSVLAVAVVGAQHAVPGVDAWLPLPHSPRVNRRASAFPGNANLPIGALRFSVLAVAVVRARYIVPACPERLRRRRKHLRFLLAIWKPPSLLSFRAECPAFLVLREAPGHAVEESLLDVNQKVAPQ